MRRPHPARLWAVALVLLAAGGLTACGDDGNSMPVVVDETTTSTTAEVFDPGAAEGTGDEDPEADDEGSGIIDLADDELSTILNELVQQTTPLPGGGGDDPGPTTPIEDATGTLGFDAPEAWGDVLEEGEGRDAPYVGASPDFQAFEDTWDAPAIAYYETGLQEDASRAAYEQFVGGTADETGNLVLDVCEEAFDRTWSRGELDLTLAYFDDCDDTTTDFAITWVVPEDGPVLAVDAQLVTQADLVALSLALDSLTFEGEPA